MVEQVLPASVAGSAHLFEEGGEFRIGDRAPVDPERLEADRMGRALVGKPAIVSHHERAACKPHHLAFGERGAIRKPERQADSRGAEETGASPAGATPRLAKHAKLLPRGAFAIRATRP